MRRSTPLRWHLLALLMVYLTFPRAARAQQPVEIRHVPLDLLDMTLVADTVFGTSIVAAPSVRSRQGVGEAHLISLDLVPDSLVSWLNVAAAYLRSPARAGAADGIRWAPPLRDRRGDGEISLGREIRKGRLRTAHLAIGDSIFQWSVTLDSARAERLLRDLLEVASRSRLLPRDSVRSPDSADVCLAPEEPLDVVFQPTPKYPGWQGRAIVQFVVDTEGVPEMSTFRVLLATHQRHGELARQAIADSRFRPARLCGAPVRTTVHQGFSFVMR
jgi:hypothetical protein